MEVVNVTYEVVIDSLLSKEEAQVLIHEITYEIESFAYVKGVEVRGESDIPTEGA